MALITKSKNKVSVWLVVQLSITLVSLYITNRISIDIWRSMTGH
jgi:hypothetical protein